MSGADETPTRMSELRSVSARIPMAILMAAERRGLDAEALLDAVGLNEEILREEDGRISIHDERRLWRECAAQLGEPLEGVDVLRELPRGFLVLPEMLLATAATFGDALHAGIDFMPLIRDGLSIHTVEHAELLELSYHFDEHLRALEFISVEIYLNVLLTFGAACSGPQPAVRTITLPDEGLDSAQARELLLREHGDANILSDSKRMSLVFPRAVLNLKQRSSAPRLHGVLRAHAAEVMAERGTDTQLLSRVRHMLMLEFERGYASLERVSRRVNMSKRSLQRRLAEHSTSFVEVREGLRQTLAQQYLRDSELQVAEISYRLGYRSPQAFNRAFHVWFNCAPSSWRKRGEGG